MRKLLVAALMVLSFAGGTLFGQWTDIDFLGMVVEQANATLDTAHADGPGETAETTSDVSAPDPAPGASEPAVSEPVEEAATDTAPPPVDPVPDTEMPVPAASDFELAGTLDELAGPRFVSRNPGALKQQSAGGLTRPTTAQLTRTGQVAQSRRGLRRAALTTERHEPEEHAAARLLSCTAAVGQVASL